MSSLQKRGFDSPDETLPFQAHGRADVVILAGFTVGRATIERGWTWSQDVQPIAGTDSCLVRHAGVCVVGQMTVRGDDSTGVSYAAGDVVVMDLGHDVWVTGGEACVMFDTGVAPYAKLAGSSPTRAGPMPTDRKGGRHGAP